MRYTLTVLLLFLYFTNQSVAQTGDWYNDDGGFTFEGFGTEEQPYLISSESVLVYLAEQVNGVVGKDYQDTYFFLTDDLDLGAHYWKPIGIDPLHNFKGIFNGNGKTISNLYIGNPETESYPVAGLFGYVGNGAIIENLTIHGGEIKGYDNGEISRTASLAGYLLCNVQKDSDSIIIRNCHNIDTKVISGESIYSNTGGLVGDGYAFCDSDGSSTILIENCTNRGPVEGKPGSFMYTGGIIGKGRGHGYCDGSISAFGSFIIRSCANEAYITGGNTHNEEGISSTGGIFGFGYSTGDGYGDSDGSGNFTIEYCINTGFVKGGDAENEHAISYTGGIFGYGDGYGYGDKSGNNEQTSNGNGYGSGIFTITSCINRGIVEGGNMIIPETISSTGGIFGYASATSAGNDVGHGYGYASFSLRNCYSYADITSKNGYIGGLGGWISTSGNGPNHTLSAIVHDSYAVGNINKGRTGSTLAVGGIIGRIHKADEANNSPKIERCLSVLSYLSGNKTKTFRIAGELLNIKTPTEVLTDNYAYVIDGVWSDRRTALNGEDWQGLMTTPPISEWNKSDNAWNIRDTFSAMPTLRGIPNQRSVPIP